MVRGGGHAVTVVREVRKSERVPQWFMLRFRFVDPAFFERPVSTQLWDQRPPPVATTETMVWRVPDLAAIGPMGATSRGTPLGSMRARFSRNPPLRTAGRSRCTARWRWRDHAVRRDQAAALEAWHRRAGARPRDAQADA
jgi:hypothetical protein